MSKILSGTYLSRKRRCSQSAGKTSLGPLHMTIIAPSMIRETLTTQISVGSFKGVKGPHAGKEGKSVYS